MIVNYHNNCKGQLMLPQLMASFLFLSFSLPLGLFLLFLRLLFSQKRLVWGIAILYGLLCNQYKTLQLRCFWNTLIWRVCFWHCWTWEAWEGWSLIGVDRGFCTYIFRYNFPFSSAISYWTKLIFARSSFPICENRKTYY